MYFFVTIHIQVGFFFLQVLARVACKKYSNVSEDILLLSWEQTEKEVLLASVCGSSHCNFCSVFCLEM